MKYTIVIQPRAQDDIIDAYMFIQMDAPMNAEYWLRGLYAAIATLETFPKRCGFAREYEGVNQELRQLIYKSHRVIFEIDGSEVHVMHVRHAAQKNLPPQE